MRLRIINASAMTIFNFRIPGLPMTVVAADALMIRRRTRSPVLNRPVQLSSGPRPFTR
ncbi:MAG: hypothetical protein RLN75_00865 [Longimicrobiales bacterium]